MYGSWILCSTSRKAKTARRKSALTTVPYCSLGGGHFHSWCPSSTDRGLATENPDRLGRSVGVRAAPAAPQSRYRTTEVSFFTIFSGFRAHNHKNRLRRFDTRGTTGKPGIVELNGCPLRVAGCRSRIDSELVTTNVFMRRRVWCETGCSHGGIQDISRQDSHQLLAARRRLCSMHESSAGDGMAE